jgi:REP element-mobilizing transposase RayT
MQSPEGIFKTGRGETPGIEAQSSIHSLKGNLGNRESILAQSLSKLYVHLVFSTKNRRDWIDAAIQPQLFAYMAMLLKDLGCHPVIVGGMPDHLHLLADIAKTRSISEVAGDIKRKSSKWIKRKGRKYAKFSWQNGYGAFSVSQSQLEIVRQYIENQDAHHNQFDFKTELRTIMNRYGIDYDERYLWD